MGRFIKAVLVTLSVFAALGCDYLPRSASWPLSDEQTQHWLQQTPNFYQGVKAAYAQHQVVAIGDYHWNNRVMAEVNGLLQHPEFLHQVKQLVVEFGNARHQQAMDDYLNGKTDDELVLDAARRDALFFTAWMPEVYADFFKIVRAYNLSVNEEKRVKVWLAESPFYWERITGHDQWQQAANHKTDGFVNAAQQAMASGDKVFMVFGAFHLLNIEPQPKTGALPMATLLKHAYPNKIFTVWPITEPQINEALSSLAVPSLLPTAVPAASELKLVDILPKARIRLGRLERKEDSVQKLIDGLLYVGPSERLNQFPESIMQDQAWLTEMEARLNMVGGRPLSAFKEIVSNSALAN